MELIGTDDVLSLDLRTMNVAGVDRSGWRFPETRHWPLVNGRIGGAARLQMEHFLECVTTNTRPLCDGQAGRAALTVCLAAEASRGMTGPRCHFRRSNRQKRVRAVGRRTRYMIDERRVALARMTSPEAAEALARAEVALIPVGRYRAARTKHVPGDRHGGGLPTRAAYLLRRSIPVRSSHRRCRTA